MNKQKEMWKALMLSSLIFAPLSGHAQDIEATLLLKQPGNLAVAHQLHLNNNGKYEAKGTQLPLQISQTVTTDGDDKIVTINLKADADVTSTLALSLPQVLAPRVVSFICLASGIIATCVRPKRPPRLQQAAVGIFATTASQPPSPVCITPPRVQAGACCV